MLPSPAVLRSEVERAGLKVVNSIEFEKVILKPCDVGMRHSMKNGIKFLKWVLMTGFEECGTFI